MSEQRLRPARLEPRGQRTDYGPRLPWKWLIVGVTLLSVVGGGYWLRQEAKAEALRGDILAAYEQQVTPMAERVNQFRSKLEGWVMEAAAEEPESWADPRLTLAGLHDAQGVYLRVPAKGAESAEAIASAAKEMQPDAIGRCLGLTPISLRVIYERGAFLMPGWIDRAKEASSMMRLRVIDDELARRVRRDLPMVLNTLDSDYFLLVVERGKNRREPPVDVYLWDLRSGNQLLRARTEPRGMLIPVRIAGAGSAAAPPKLDSSGAVDCSIAAQVKELTGSPTLNFGSGEVLEKQHAEQEAKRAEEAKKKAEQEAEKAEKAAQGEQAPAGDEGEPKPAGAKTEGEGGASTETAKAPAQPAAP